MATPTPEEELPTTVEIIKVKQRGGDTEKNFKNPAFRLLSDNFILRLHIPAFSVILSFFEPSAHGINLVFSPS
jgi:hypothetical protein